MQLINEYYQYKTQILEFLKQYVTTNAIPYSIRRIPFANYQKFVDGLLDDLNPLDNYVPSITFFLYLKKSDEVIGAINLRLNLNEYLLNEGGHIGIGILASQRNKGYATLAIKLALKYYQRLNIDQILMTCNYDNIASEKSIIKSGGQKTTDTICKKGVVIKRFWLQTKEHGL